MPSFPFLRIFANDPPTRHYRQCTSYARANMSCAEGEVYKDKVGCVSENAPDDSNETY